VSRVTLAQKAENSGERAVRGDDSFPESANLVPAENGGEEGRDDFGVEKLVRAAAEDLGDPTSEEENRAVCGRRGSGSWRP